MFTRRYKIFEKYTDQDILVYIPMYREWYSWRWHSLFVNNDDHCDTIDEAVECIGKVIMARFVSAETGEQVSPNEIDDFGNIKEEKEEEKES